jgi:ubiquinol-cytochrome c reductase cytochrome b subunit
VAVDYRKQYRPDLLEPFWPNEIIRMIVVVLCTLAVIMVLVVLPTVLEWAGIGGLVHEDEPADPHVTPEHIKPEWYFLATYQYLKLMEYPQRWFGIDGKMLGVLSQGPLMLAILLLPLWYRRRAHQRAGRLYVVLITAIVFVFFVLTLWAIWPVNALFWALLLAVLIVFYALMWQEQRALNRFLGPDRDTMQEKP